MRRLIILFAILAVFIGVLVALPNPTITGKAYDEEMSAFTLYTHITRFFNINDVVFPQQITGCMPAMQDVFYTITLTPLEVTSSFLTTPSERIASYVFGFGRSVGTLDMMKGKSFVNYGDGYIALSTETMIRLPPDMYKKTAVQIELYGEISDNFYVTRGSFRTPATECSFETTGGTAVCSCMPVEPIPISQMLGIYA